MSHPIPASWDYICTARAHTQLSNIINEIYFVCVLERYETNNSCKITQVTAK